MSSLVTTFRFLSGSIVSEGSCTRKLNDTKDDGPILERIVVVFIVGVSVKNTKNNL